MPGELGRGEGAHAQGTWAPPLEGAAMQRLERGLLGRFA